MRLGGIVARAVIILIDVVREKRPLLTNLSERKPEQRTIKLFANAGSTELIPFDITLRLQTRYRYIGNIVRRNVLSLLLPSSHIMGMMSISVRSYRSVLSYIVYFVKFQALQSCLSILSISSQCKGHQQLFCFSLLPTSISNLLLYFFPVFSFTSFFHSDFRQ